MQILIKKDFFADTETVLNILYGENHAYLENWIKSYLDQEINNLKKTANNDDEFFVEIKDNTYHVIKKTKIILKGYLYNSKKITSVRLFSIKPLTYNNTEPFLNQIEKQPFWNSINTEITHRIMKHLDKDSLFKINMKFESAIKTKETWNSTELVMLQNEIIKNYKKELYNSMTKKFKKFEKPFQSNHKLMPSCSLEYNIINKKHKLD